MRFMSLIMLVCSTISYASPHAVRGELERDVSMSLAELQVWLAVVVQEVDEAVTEAQAEIALLPEIKILPCHVHHLERLEQLQRAVQNGSVGGVAARSAAQMRLIGIAR
ncbi:MAG: creatinine amidohydrolase/Fe(II)-dependent formamide hydrolase-like protein, partial [Kiritimatiellia bacterium]